MVARGGNPPHDWLSRPQRRISVWLAALSILWTSAAVADLIVHGPYNSKAIAQVECTDHASAAGATNYTQSCLGAPTIPAYSHNGDVHQFTYVGLSTIADERAWPKTSAKWKAKRLCQAVTGASSCANSAAYDGLPAVTGVVTVTESPIRRVSTRHWFPYENACAGSWVHVPGFASSVKVCLASSSGGGEALGDGASPPPNDLTCGAGLSSTVGNPINLATRNKVEAAADYRGSGPLPVEWSRTYNSIDAKWRFSYSRHVFTDALGFLVAQRDDGGYRRFHDVSGTWTPFEGVLMDISGDFATGFTLTHHARDEVESYDASGRLTQIANSAGQTLSFAYVSDASGNTTTTITDVRGRAYVIVSDSFGRVLSFADPTGNLYRYQYSDANLGNLQYVLWPDGDADPNNDPRVEYVYDGNFRLIGKRDEQGTLIGTYTYVGSSREPASTAGAAVGTTMTNAFGASYVDPTTVTVTNPLGKSETWTLARIAGIKRIVGVDGLATTLCPATVRVREYNVDGLVSASVSENGTRTEYVRDSRGLVTSVTEAVGTSLERTTTTTWRSDHPLRSTHAEPGRTTIYTYCDEVSVNGCPNLPLLQAVDVVDAADPNNHRVTTYTYTAQGLLAGIDGPRPDSDAVDTTTFTYYTTATADHAIGDLHTVTDAQGNVATVSKYDARGFATEIIDPNGTVTTRQYDPRGRIISVTVDGVETAYAWTASTPAADARDLLHSVTVARGTTDEVKIDFEYDAAQRLSAMSNALGHRAEWDRDAAGNVTAFRYCSNDDCSIAANVAFEETRLYDELSRLRAVTTGASLATTSYDYDLANNPTTVTDALSYTPTRLYDALDRVYAVTDPSDTSYAAADGNDVRYDFDVRDNVTSVIAANGVTTSFSFDGLDNLTQETSPDSGLASNTYDAAGNLLRSVRDDQTLVFEYDALGRISRAGREGATAGQTDAAFDIVYGYDDATVNGRGRTTAIDGVQPWHGGVQLGIGYDSRGNIVTWRHTVDGRLDDGTGTLSSVYATRT